MMKSREYNGFIIIKAMLRFLSFIILSFLIIFIIYTLSSKSERESNNAVYEEQKSVPPEPGDYGEPYHVDSKYQTEVHDSYVRYGFNQFASDRISVSRPLKDTRPPTCSGIRYSIRKAKVSVIIVFYDEGLSTLMRTIFSVLNRSPKSILHEIVLVDDHSTMDHLKNPLDDFISKNPIVKLVRLPMHDGLIAARLAGAEAATGNYLVFLDSHCEANIGWLPPLIYPISKDYRVVTCPTIDMIDHNTFEYLRYGGIDGETARGTISWLFHYKERQPSTDFIKTRKSKADNVPSPVMAGGLFAISRKWWNELGKYDPGMFIWGGEQYELSFKLWMCGGSMFNVPCSRVGHVYRGPYLIRDQQGINERHPNSVNINYKRVAEVWMDDYKEFLYAFRPNIRDARAYDIGLNERKQIRENLKCKSFQWYLKNVINDTLYTAFEPDRAWEKIRNKGSNKCLSIHDESVVIGECYNSYSFRWTWIKEIREEEHCLEFGNDYSPKWIFCHEQKGNQHFSYEIEKNGTIESDNGMCLTHALNDKIIFEKCDRNNSRQHWEIKLRDLSKPDRRSEIAIHQPRNP